MSLGAQVQKIQQITILKNRDGIKKSCCPVQKIQQITILKNRSGRQTQRTPFKKYNKLQSLRTVFVHSFTPKCSKNTTNYNP